MPVTKGGKLPPEFCNIIILGHPRPQQSVKPATPRLPAQKPPEQGPIDMARPDIAEGLDDVKAPSELTTEFPEGTRFFDVDGVAVAELPDKSCVRADGTPYPIPAKVFAYGMPINEAEFRALASE